MKIVLILLVLAVIAFIAYRFIAKRTRNTTSLISQETLRKSVADRIAAYEKAGSPTFGNSYHKNTSAPKAVKKQEESTYSYVDESSDGFTYTSGETSFYTDPTDKGFVYDTNPPTYSNDSSNSSSNSSSSSYGSSYGSSDSSGSSSSSDSGSSGGSDQA